MSMICAGIDAGSRSIKVVLIDGTTREVIATGSRDQGVDQEALARTLFDELREECGNGKADGAAVVATGYGRHLIHFANRSVTEITCHALGVMHQHPGARCIVEVGGQDSKLIRLDDKGRVHDFAMNDRCAAGTGRFLEVVATRLGVKLTSLAEMAARSQSPASISSMCVVFAETEIVGLLASGTSPDDIVAGVLTAIAQRVTAMGHHSIKFPVIFTGGVALIPGMADSLSAALAHPVTTAQAPQFTGALGAALLAARH